MDKDTGELTIKRDLPMGEHKYVVYCKIDNNLQKSYECFVTVTSPNFKGLVECDALISYVYGQTTAVEPTFEVSGTTNSGNYTFFIDAVSVSTGAFANGQTVTIPLNTTQYQAGNHTFKFEYREDANTYCSKTGNISIQRATPVITSSNSDVTVGYLQVTSAADNVIETDVPCTISINNEQKNNFTIVENSTQKFTISPISSLGAGEHEYTVTVKPIDATNYQNGKVNGKVSVTKKAIQITADPSNVNTKGYGDAHTKAYASEVTGGT
jgi:hypothetical protein